MTGSGSDVKINLSYVHAITARGKVYTYYRRDGQRIPIKGPKGERLEPGSRQWMAAYQRIHDAHEQPAKDSAGEGTLAHVIEAFLKSPDYNQLADKTRKDYRRYLDYLKERYGHLPMATMPVEFKLKLRDDHADKPRTANYLVSVLRLLCTFAEERPRKFLLPPGWQNPARRPKTLRTGGGHRPWEEYEVEAFRKHWPADSLERVAFELLLNTGQRGGDIVAMVRQHYYRGWIKVAQDKTGERVDVPASNALKEVLEPWLKSHQHVVILTGERGKGFGVDYFRHLMRDAYREAGLPDDCTTHGLRYTAATVLKELGLGWEDIGAITGHTTAQMVRKYTEKRRRAAVAIAKLDAYRKGRNENDSEG